MEAHAIQIPNANPTTAIMDIAVLLGGVVKPMRTAQLVRYAIQILGVIIHQ
jgi:hypothetical protein